MVSSTLVRLKRLLLPALVLAFWVGLNTPLLAQVSAPTQTLFKAVEVNDMNAVKSAISAGADLGAKNAAGKTAADVAVDKGHFIIAHYLLSERSAKNTAKRLTNSAQANVRDRLRKQPSKTPTKTSPRRVKPKPKVKAQPRKLSPNRPDTATRVTEFLRPVTPRAKPRAPSRTLAERKYGLPPRKPLSIAEMATPIRKEVAVTRSPGVQNPDGRDPFASPSEPLPVLRDEAAAPSADELDDLMAAETLEPGASAPTRSDPSSINPVASIGTFFKSIVDLVTPGGGASQSSEEPQLSDNVTSPTDTSRRSDDGVGERSQAPLADEDLALSETDNRASSENESESLEDMGTLEESNKLDDDLLSEDVLEADALEEIVSDDILELEDNAAEPRQQVAQAPRSSASERTMDRIRSLLGDSPDEDEFGLPSVDIPTREIATGEDAVDTVLDRLTDSRDDRSGFLDDRPGPETGPALAPIGDERPQLPVSDAMRSRLQRLGDAVSRDVVVDTNSILRQGRERSLRTFDTPLEQRPTSPRQTMPRTSGQILDESLSSDSQLRRRTTASERFAARLKRIQELEQLREDPFGLPIGGTRTPIAPAKIPKVMPAPAQTGEQMDDDNSLDKQTEDEKEPQILDRVVNFFGGSQTRQPSRQPEATTSSVTEYRGSPNTRPVADREDAREIENLEAFDSEDETQPSQEPGSLEPIFLERLAGLFNEEEEKQTEGWKAEVESGSPFPGRGEMVNAAGSEPWTTTVELNVGENKDPVIIQVAQTPLANSNGVQGGAEAPAVTKAASVKAVGRSGGKQSEMAKKAYGDPLREPDAKKAAVQQKTFFGRLTKLFQPQDRLSLERESLLLEPDEKLSTAHDASDGGVKVASRTEGDPKTYWPITRLTKTDAPVSGQRRPSALTRTSLTDVTLTMGESVHLDNTFPPGKDGTDPNNECVKKNRGTTLFCIEPIDWPQDLRQAFVITTILYTGPMAIVRYDQAAATRLHSLYQSADFEKVIAYYQNRFGEPTEILKRSIAPLAKPRQDNPTVSWRSRDERTNAVTVLEIRKFDDTRGGFPDTNRGAVMLYFTTSPSIFPQVSSHELMRLKRFVDVTQTEAEQNAGQDGAPFDVDNPAGNSGVSPDELFGAEPVIEDDLPSASDATLDALPDADSDLLFENEQLERPEDILNEPDLLEPDLMEPNLLEPELNANDNFAPDALSDEPITDEQPDEIIELLAPQNGNPS